MKRVVFLTAKDKISDYLATPVRHNRRRLRELGHDVRFRHDASPAGLECDILCLVSKPVMDLAGERAAFFEPQGRLIRFLGECRKRASKLVWFDLSDSTGVTHFELLPHVDLYLKKQLLKDRTLYKKPFVGGRIYSDYYHRVFGVEDAAPFEQFHPLDEADWPKVDLSWNIGMGDVFNGFTRYSSLRRQFPGLLPPRYAVPCVDPASPRLQDFFLRTTADMGRESVSFDRKTLIERLDALLKARPDLTGSVRGQLPVAGYRKRFPFLRHKAFNWLPGLPGIAEYRRQLAGSKLSFGPFGWGELNVKEYETMILGAALVRPDISHMETWPDIFVPHETYAPYRWDFSDLEDVVLGLLGDDKARVALARRGQEAYRDMVSPAGMERFCRWFVRQIER
ncbi:hypothetical protein NNJEOMEG_02007 [Fundidesulfovibrio magnetotacticus]|uniref:Glycosyltransferase family 1 protein n=1 Tax=Fundidesulfovibrio magnetotacticus TaxID=2730080 RepID=A0A6V8LWY2_9BACT|nr:hypothetical protein [Fundidesulfovibrio magnetotacticus]GFK94167.1 hypothetical protein NNJEOMEG_02007 [Fundidesulfovibrio magnetotacticus]